MKTVIRTIFIFIMFCTGVLATQTVLSTSAIAAEENQHEQQDILFKLGHFTDDLHSTFMGLKLASGLQERGHRVTIFLNLEAVRLVDKRHPLDLGWGHNKSLLPIYEKFIASGGKVLVCPHCAKVAGIKSNDLREGAIIARHGDLMALIEKSDKVLDY